MEINNLLNLLDNVKNKGNGRYVSCCPAHKDKTPSLAITETGDRILLHCFGGCSVGDVLGSLGLQMSDLYQNNNNLKEAGSPQLSESQKNLLNEKRLLVEITQNESQKRQLTTDELARMKKAKTTIRKLEGITEMSKSLRKPKTIESSSNNMSDVKQKEPMDEMPIPAGFKVDRSGVYFLKEDKNGDKEQIKVCTFLKVIALTRNEDAGGWGRLLEWYDSDGNYHKWAMPMHMLAKDGSELRGILLDQGLEIGSGQLSKKYLNDYLTMSNPRARAKCVTKTGWHGDSFVLPDAVINNSESEQVVFQGNSENLHFRQSGSLAEWQSNIAKYCSGNSRLMFAVSIPFAAPLLDIVNSDGCGFNFRGTSSEGKTTALRVASSVCGGPDYKQSWRATDNGLEGIAQRHNDTLLALDEMGEVDPNKVGEIAYMLANGVGKQRANKNGESKSKHTWRVLFLSTGEISLADHLGSVGRKAKAGQEVRLIDIPMDTGIYGGFENIHGFNSAAEFSDHLAFDMIRKYHGTVFRLYLEMLIGTLPKRKDRKSFIQVVHKTAQESFADVLPSNASGQVQRVANKFMLVASAGMIASQFKLTGWEPNEPLDAAKKCFKAWLDDRGGTGNKEDQQAIEQVESFFQSHGESRFSDWNNLSSKTINRVGFKKQEEKEITYYVFSNAFRSEICKGFNSSRVAELCMSKGLLKPDSKGGPSHSFKLPDSSKKQRVYIFTKCNTDD